MINKLKLILFFLFVTGIVGYSQNPRFTNYKIIKSRKNVEANSIFQDNKGFIWLGTNYGLVKFDGIDFTVYTELDSLADIEVSSIDQDSNGLLWIGHKSGNITIYENSQFKKFDPEEGLSKNEVSSFYFDNQNTMWFSTFGEGIYYFMGKNRKRLYNLNVDDGLLDNFVYSIVQDSNGLFYFATDKGISVYDQKSDAFIEELNMSGGLPDNIVKHLFIKDNHLWIGMEDAGVCVYDIKNKKYDKILDWNYGSLNDFIYKSDQEIWISTKRKGIVKCSFDSNGQVWHSNYTKNNGIADSRTKTIFLDRENNIWVGTINGLSLRKNDKIEFLMSKDGLDVTNIFNFKIDDAGNYWIASDKGLFVISKDREGNIKQKQVLNHPQFEFCSFISLYKDNEGFIWAGTYGFGAFRINPITLEFKQYTTADGLSNDNVIHINGRGNTLWFSTLGGGLTKYNITDNQNIIVYNNENGLRSDYVYSTFIDSNNKVWIATDGGGIEYIQDDKVYPFIHIDVDTTLKTAYTIIEDLNHNIWFNYSDKGLFRYDGDKLIAYNEKTGLKSNYIQGLQVDKSGNLFVVSNEGIDKIMVADNSIEHMGEEFGLAYLDPNLNAICKDNEDNIWIGTAEGLVKINSDRDDDILPNIFITQKNLFSDPIIEDKEVFRHNQNYFTFFYKALWYQNGGKLNYRYQLEGYDMDWNAETNLGLVTYSNLPHGKYKFRVQVKLSGNKWFESEDSVYSFRIKKPFWKTTAFILLFIATVSFVIASFFRIRLNNLKRAKELLELEVKKRTSEIQKQKDKIENQRDEIEAQRNQEREQRTLIEKQNTEITSSIIYAKRIQNAVLPPDDSFKRLLGNNYFVFFKPRDIVSGDFYYLNQKDNKIVLAAADCTGHGVPGAFMSILGISILNQIMVQLDDNFNAGEILTKLRSQIKLSLRQTGKEGEAKDGMDISMCVIDKESEKISFAGAYNPLLLVRNGEEHIYKADRMPIGIYLREKEEFTNHSIELKKGDQFYMYSDGFQDQFGGEKKSKFLAKKLRDFLIEISADDIKQQETHLENKFNNWKGDEPQIDDVLIIGFKI